MEFRKERNYPGMDILDGDGSCISSVETHRMFADGKEFAIWDDEFPMEFGKWSFSAVRVLDLTDIFPIRKELMRRWIDAIAFSSNSSNFFEE